MESLKPPSQEQEAPPSSPSKVSCLEIGKSPKQVESSLIEAGIDLDTASTGVQKGNPHAK